MTKIADRADTRTLARDIVTGILPQALGLDADTPTADDAPIYTLDIRWAYNRKGYRAYDEVDTAENIPSYDGDGTRVAVTLTVEGQRESWDQEAPILCDGPLNEDPITLTLEYNPSSAMGQRLIALAVRSANSDRAYKKAVLAYQIAEMQAQLDNL